MCDQIIVEAIDAIGVRYSEQKRNRGQAAAGQPARGLSAMQPAAKEQAGQVPECRISQRRGGLDMLALRLARRGVL